MKNDSPLIIIFSIAIISYGVWLSRYSEDYIMEYEFSGIVQRTSSAKVGFLVFVNNKDYFISGSTVFTHKLSKGDSIIKVKNSRIFWVIDHITKKKSYYE